MRRHLSLSRLSSFSRLSPLSPLAALALTSLFGACGADSASGSFSDIGNWTTPSTSATDAATAADTFDPGPGADTGVGIDTSTGPDLPQPPPPETEQDFDLRTPEAGDSFLYIPSAALDALIIVDARTLAVSLVEVGVTPTLVRALPGDEGAVVLNEGGSNVSIVRPHVVSGGGPTRTFDVVTLDVVVGANRLERSPDGRFAFAFFDESKGTDVAGFGSLQDISAVRLDQGQEAVFNLAVGYRPSIVDFADADRLALFFCEDGISGIRLDDLVGDTFLPPVPTSTDPFAKPVDREIVVTPDGRFAAVRDLRAPVLTWVDLQTAVVKELSLPDYASDLELTPDGQTLIVPMRTSQTVAVISVPAAFDFGADRRPRDPAAVGEPERAHRRHRLVVRLGGAHRRRPPRAPLQHAARHAGGGHGRRRHGRGGDAPAGARARGGGGVAELEDGRAHPPPHRLGGRAAVRLLAARPRHRLLEGGLRRAPGDRGALHRRRQRALRAGARSAGRDPRRAPRLDALLQRHGLPGARQAGLRRRAAARPQGGHRAREPDRLDHLRRHPERRRAPGELVRAQQLHQE
ncbi:MAG: hypothetical protein U1F43_33250 [Myxococcota bacterium]